MRRGSTSKTSTTAGRASSPALYSRPDEVDLRWITRKYFWDFDDPAVINSGWCYVWAWLAWLAHPDAQLITFHDHEKDRSAYEQHAFVQIGELYYDSSRPAGCKVVTEMEFFEDFHDHVREKWIMRMTPEQFKSWWGKGSEFDDQDLPRWPTVLPPYGPTKKEDV